LWYDESGCPYPNGDNDILPTFLIKRLLMYRKGFWLILIEIDGAEMAVACQILARTDSMMRLQALIPPSWYPQTFTSFKVREDGEILGYERLPTDRLIQVPAHAGLLTVDLDFHPSRSPLTHSRVEGQAFAAQGK
jgi:hypothetical protein